MGERLPKMRECLEKENFELRDQTIWGEIIGWLGVATSAHFFD